MQTVFRVAVVWVFYLLLVAPSSSPSSRRPASPIPSGSQGSTCGGVHCFGASVYCCTDDFGEQSCCHKSMYQASWFWILLVIGLLLIGTMLVCFCRACYRYHNAGQYTKLRLQCPNNYGSISHAVANTSMPPPPVCNSAENGDCGQLPSYAAVMSMPPAYNDIDTEGSLNNSQHYDQ